MATTNLNNQANVFYRKNDFDALINLKGYSVKVERALRCPCQTAENHPLTDCQNCNSTGYVFIAPIITKAIIHSINYDQKLKDWSPELIGTVSVTVRGDVEKLNFMDRVTLVNDDKTENKSVFSEVLTLRNVGAGNYIFTSYKATDIVGIFVFVNSTTPLVYLDAKQYTVNTENPYVIDFSFDFTSIANFNGTVTILYGTEMQYHVIDIPHNIRNSYKLNHAGAEEQILLPVNAIARLANNVLSVSKYDGTGIQINTIPIGSKKWVFKGNNWIQQSISDSDNIWNG